MGSATRRALAVTLILLTLTVWSSSYYDGSTTNGASQFNFEAFDRNTAVDAMPYADLSPLEDVEVHAEGALYTLTVTFRFNLLDATESDICDGASVELKRMVINSYQTIQSGYTDDQGTIVFNNVNGGTYLVRIESDDDRWVRVADGSKALDPNYHWNTQQFTLVGDRQLEYSISDQTRGAWAIYHDLRDGADWLWEQTGWQRSPITVVWPEGDWPHSHGDVIHVPSDENVAGTIWRSDISLHEYAHCIHFELRGGNFPLGDGPDPHYIDSESSPGFAFSEGWAQFFERAVENDPERSDGSSLESTLFADGPFGNGDEGDMNGAEVEGAVANLFWDIYDGVDSEDRAPESERGDQVDRKFSVLWDIIYHEQPNDVNDIKRAWPLRDADVQAIFHNARIPMELDPPSNPTSFFSSHEVDMGSLDSTLYLRWLGAADDGSGVLGYSIVIDGQPHSVPDEVMDYSSDHLTTVSLIQGVYYIHIRTVDQDGNWAEDVYSIGPFVISEGAVPVDEPLFPEGDDLNALLGLVTVVSMVGLGLLMIFSLDRRRGRSAPPVTIIHLAGNCPYCGRLDQGGSFCLYCGGRLR